MQQQLTNDQINTLMRLMERFKVSDKTICDIVWELKPKSPIYLQAVLKDYKKQLKTPKRVNTDWLYESAMEDWLYDDEHLG